MRVPGDIDSHFVTAGTFTALIATLCGMCRFVPEVPALLPPCIISIQHKLPSPSADPPPYRSCPITPGRRSANSGTAAAGRRPERRAAPNSRTASTSSRVSARKIWDTRTCRFSGIRHDHITECGDTVKITTDGKYRGPLLPQGSSRWLQQDGQCHQIQHPPPHMSYTP